jgi:NAD(P)-dependent dehydrogenase (short-subunit alcohol dehydrogenase family)
MGAAQYPRQCRCPGHGAHAVALARIPLGRFPTAEEIADAVCYLASDAAASITGQILVLDGGLTAV